MNAEQSNTVLKKGLPKLEQASNPRANVGKVLGIAEKPSVATDIAKVLKAKRDKSKDKEKKKNKKSKADKKKDKKGKKGKKEDVVVK